MKIEDLYIYPIKSTKGQKITEVNVNKIGFENDRYFGIANAKNEIITARENSELLKIKTEINNDKLKVIYENESKIICFKNEFNDIQLSLFKKNVTGEIISSEIDNWLTGILKLESKLVKVNLKKLRKTNATEISFNDIYPIHLISRESVKALNKKLETPIELNRFRPNIIISGFKAFEEETWTGLIIGECEFKVISKTERCSLITINPLSGEKDKKQEPLRTLAKEHKSNGKVNFGIYLIPIKTGTINKSDTLKIKTTGNKV